MKIMSYDHVVMDNGDDADPSDATPHVKAGKQGSAC